MTKRSNLQSRHLRPFQSYGLLKSKTKRRAVDSVLKSIEKVIVSDRPRQECSSPKILKNIEKFTEDSVDGKGFIYQVEELPSWVNTQSDVVDKMSRSDADMTNRTQHLVLLLKYKTIFALYTSNPSDWDKVVKHVNANGIPNITLVASALINGAFTDSRWPMSSVWMKGLHHSVETKADSKQLSGRNVRSAIDKFGDQTYHFSSGRTFIQDGSPITSLGLSPARHRIWLGRSSDFTDFCEKSKWAMQRLSQGETKQAPIEQLAQPLESLNELGVPDEIGWAPQWGKDPFEKDTSEAFKLLYGVALGFDSTSSSITEGRDARCLSIQVTADGRDVIGPIALANIYYSKAVNKIVLSFEPIEKIPVSQQYAEALQVIFVNEGWGELRYRNGAVVSGDSAFYPHYSSLPFTGWDWVNFDTPDAFDITKEKPIKAAAETKRNTDLRLIGAAGEDSLFSWAYRRWGADREGFLLCDDGSGEIADFLYLSPVDADGESVLSLIHAKASTSSASDRQLSVSNYEVVVAQAMKNLSHASPSSIIRKLETLSSGARVWIDGVQSGDAVQFARELSGRGSKVRLRIVILQPHAMRSGYEIDIDVTSQIKALRHAQLSTLLLEAEAACHRVGASFSVIASSP